MFERLWILNIWPITSKFHLTFQPPWSHQCRKFDAHLVYYGQPFITLSIGLTVPFLFSLYLGLGMKLRWWSKGFPFKLADKTSGVWVFVGSRQASASFKVGEYSREWLKKYRQNGSNPV